MSAKKRSRESASRWAEAAAYLQGPGRAVTLTVILVVAFLGVWGFVWDRVGGYVLSSDDYVVTADRVEVVTPRPDWIRTDVPAEVIRNASLDGPLSIMDDELAKRIADAFASHPWVAKVLYVRKCHPARVEVALQYRRPICMVELRGELLPIDAQGVLLPRGDFSPVEIARYPTLANVRTTPIGTVGESWGDARVSGGAEVLATLAEAWDEFDFVRIVPSDPLSPNYEGECSYTLVTRGGTSVFWGRAPSTNAPGELLAEEKIVRLKQYVALHGTLEGRDGPQRLDVYRLRASAAAPEETPDAPTG